MIHRVLSANRLAYLTVLLSGALLGNGFVSRLSFAQEVITLDPSKRISQYIHSSWNTDDGLPQNSVSALTQSQNGYIWFGTEEGLVRFDGVTFATFDKQTDPAFRVNDIVTMIETRDGSIWSGTRGGGIVVFDGIQFSSINDSTGLGSNFITTLSEDQEGHVWIGTYGGGLAKYNRGVITNYDAEAGFTAEFVSEVVQDQAKNLWIGTEQGLFRFHNNTFSPFEEWGLETAFITTLFQDASQQLWIATRESGLYVLSADSLRKYDHPELENGYITAIVQDHEGSLWLGMTGGVLIRLSGAHSERVESNSSLTESDILSLVEDQEGSLWIGTQGGGVHQIRNDIFTPFSAQEGLTNDRVYSVYDQEGVGTWVGTASGLNLLRANQLIPIPWASSLDTQEILAIWGDGDNDIWLGTYGNGLFHVQNNKLKQFTVADNLPSDNIFALHSDREGTLWIGTDAGVSVFDGKEFSTIDKTQGLPSQFITAFEESFDGSMWIGTYDAGLVKYGRGEIHTYSIENGLSANGVLSLHEDTAGVLWAGTYGGGLNRLHQDKVVSYSSQDGLYNDNVYVIIEDDENYLWMTCNKGVFRVEKSALTRIANGEDIPIKSAVYGKPDGLRSAEATGGQQPAGWKARDGRLWFPTIGGVVSIDPSSMTTNAVVPPVVIEDMVIDYKSRDLQGAIHIEAGAKKLQITFTAPSFVEPNRVQFQYKLEGTDTEWSDPDTRREAFYTNLNPGQYTFRVRASNNDGVWNEEGAMLSFYLEPHFYQTAWFRSGVLLFLIAVGVIAYRGRIQQLKARQEALEHIVDERTRDLRIEKEKTEESKKIIEAQAEHLKELDRFKTRFFANISHEFRTPLTMIIGPLENAIGGMYGSLDEKLERQVGIMLRNAQRLLRLINQLLDLSKIESGKMELRTQQRNIVPFLEGVLLSSTSLAEKKAITLHFDTPRDEIGLYYEPDKLEKVFYNLLSNALKFTPEGGTVSFTLVDHGPSEAFEEGAIEIEVRDTGRGIPEADLPHIFDRFHQVDGSNTREFEGTGIGLALVKELILLHKGSISVQSTLGEGTTFIVLLPLGCKHLAKDQITTNERGAITTNPSSVNVISELATESAQFDHDARSDHSENETDPLIASKLVVVVEDNQDVREYVSSILSDYLVVHTAEDGVEGLEKIKQLKPDLVISDVMMPRMDGNELCSRIKEDPDLNHIPVILMTARATHELRITALEMGADDYIAKPFNARELLVRARNLIIMRMQEKELKILNTNLEQQVAEQLDQMMSERLKYEAELVAAKEKAEASSHLKSIILTNFNHEFRTPISGILGGVELLDIEVDESAREFVDLIKQSTHRLQETLDALTELTSLDSQHDALKRDPVNLNQVVRNQIKQHRPAASQKGLQLIAHLGNEEVHILTDGFALQRILHHIVDNAIKFTQEGLVWMELKTENEQALLSINDTGIGMSEDFIPKVFDAFVQESAGLSRSYEGMGIGMTIVKRLTELIGGTISASSIRNEGTSITLSFPLHEPVPDPTQTSNEELAA